MGIADFQLIIPTCDDRCSCFYTIDRGGNDGPVWSGSPVDLDRTNELVRHIRLCV